MENKALKRGSIAGFLYFVMAIIAVALFMAPVKEMLTSGVNNITTNATNYELIVLIINFWPIFFFIMLLVVLIIIMRK